MASLEAAAVTAAAGCDAVGERLLFPPSKARERNDQPSSFSTLPPTLPSSMCYAENSSFSHHQLAGKAGGVCDYAQGRRVSGSAAFAADNESLYSANIVCFNLSEESVWFFCAITQERVNSWYRCYKR